MPRISGGRPAPFGLRYRSLLRESDSTTLPCSGAALSPRRATYFSLSRQRNLRKRKATLLSASLRFAAGNLRCSVQPGSSSNSLRSNNRSPYSVWTSAPRRIQKGGVWIRIRRALGPLRGLNAAIFLIAVCACIHWAVGLNVRSTARSNARYINIVLIQIKRQTAPGFTNFLYLYKCAVHSVPAQSTCGSRRNLMPRLSCSAQIKPQVLRHTLS